MRYFGALLLAVFLAIGGQLRAQQFIDFSAFSPFVGIQAGTQGIGIESGYPLGKAFNIRAGINFFPPVRFDIKNNGLKVSRSNVMLTADWQPLFGKEGWFARKWFVSAGASHFFRNEAKRIVSHSEDDGDDYDYTVKLHQVPYIGTGLNRITLGNQFYLSLNAGYFISVKSPEVIMEGTSEFHLQRQKNIRNKIGSFPYNTLKGLNAQAGFYWTF